MVQRLMALQPAPRADQEPESIIEEITNFDDGH